ncbi:hypothetical protein HDV03_001256 [Kappamyces sp. JEL0829]|nr:hypothetical protein HDV03_001256 [Kappamyces sp. JEL0829]
MWTSIVETEINPNNVGSFPVVTESSAASVYQYLSLNRVDEAKTTLEATIAVCLAECRSQPWTMLFKYPVGLVLVANVSRCLVWTGNQVVALVADWLIWKTLYWYWSQTALVALLYGIYRGAKGSLS